MSTQENDFQAWLTKIQALKLPQWADFPDFDIYMEQLINLVNQYLAPLELDPVTPAMINNYVKHKVMFKPVKKRYQREHLAAAITLTLLKTVFPLDMIRSGFNGELNVLSAQAAYDRFAANFTTNYRPFIWRKVRHYLLPKILNGMKPFNQTAATTIIYQLISKRLMLHAPQIEKGAIAHD